MVEMKVELMVGMRAETKAAAMGVKKVDLMVYPEVSMTVD